MTPCFTLMCLLCKKIKKAKDQDVLFTLLKVYKPSTCPILRCKNHKEESLYFHTKKKEFYCRKCVTENKIDTEFLRDATKEDVQNILRDIKKAYENRIKLFEE